MSRENVEIVRRFVWAFENDRDVFRDLLHPEVEWFPFEEDRTRLYGIDAAIGNRDAWLDTWDEHRLDLEELIEEGDSVVASVHLIARGKASGVAVDARIYPQFKVRDDKVVYIFDHESRAAALEAVELRE
jgi:ketosteroid isomerase-like protein